MIIITYVEFTNGSTKRTEPAALEYAEWLRDGVIEYSHAIVEGSIRTDQGEVSGIPTDVRAAIAKLVVEG